MGKAFLVYLASGMGSLVIAIVVFLSAIAYMERGMVGTSLLSAFIGFSLLSGALYLIRLSGYVYASERTGEGGEERR